MDRHIVAVLNPRTGTHRLAGFVHFGDGEPDRLTVDASQVAGIAQYLAPAPHEAVLVLTVEDSK